MVAAADCIGELEGAVGRRGGAAATRWLLRQRALDVHPARQRGERARGGGERGCRRQASAARVLSFFPLPHRAAAQGGRRPLPLSVVSSTQRIGPRTLGARCRCQIDASAKSRVPTPLAYGTLTPRTSPTLRTDLPFRGAMSHDSRCVATPTIRRSILFASGQPPPRGRDGERSAGRGSGPGVPPRSDQHANGWGSR